MQESIPIDVAAPIPSRKPPRTPAQDELHKKINESNAKIAFLTVKKDNGTATTDELKQLTETKGNVKILEKDLAVLIQGR